MKSIFFLLFLIPAFAFAQSAGEAKTAKEKAKKETKEAKKEVKKESKEAKNEGKEAKEAAKETKKEAKEAAKEVKKETPAPKATEKAEPAPKAKTTGGAAGNWVCGSSDVYHTNRECSALKSCKQVADGKGSASRECKICEKARSQK